MEAPEIKDQPYNRIAIMGLEIESTTEPLHVLEECLTRVLTNHGTHITHQFSRNYQLKMVGME